jgi:VanZ family protein
VSERNPRPGLRSPAWLWGPVLLQMVVIFIASSIPDLRNLPGGISDKSGHGLGYGILGAVLLRALAGGRLNGVTWGRAAAALILASLYGVSDEFHQSFVPGRTPDRMDVLADTIGAAVAIAIGGGARAWAILRSSSPSRRL